MAVTYLESEKARQRWLSYLEAGHQEPAQRMVATYKRSLRTIESETAPLIRRLATAKRVGDAEEAAALTTRISLAYGQAASMENAIQQTVMRGGLPQVSSTEIQRLAPRAFKEGLALGYERLSGTGVEFQRVNRQAVAQTIARMRPGTAANTWVRAFAGAQAKEATRSLARSVALGHGVEQMTRDFRQSLSGVGQQRIETFVRTEMIGAMREGNLTAYRGNADVVEGWVWNATASACAVCQGMNGSVHKMDEMMSSHPRCRCTADPLTKPFSSQGLSTTDVAETRSDGFDPNSRFVLLPDNEKRRILGAGRYNEWMAGRLDMRDVPARTNHPVWGPGLRSKTLRELDNGGGERVPVTPTGPGPITPPPAPPAPPTPTLEPPPALEAPWLDQLRAIEARHQEYGVTDPTIPQHYLDVAGSYRVDEAAWHAERMQALRGLDEHLAQQLDDLLEAGRIIDEEVQRRARAYAGVVDSYPLEQAKRLLKIEQDGLHAYEFVHGPGVKAGTRNARIQIRKHEARIAELEAGADEAIRKATHEVLSEVRPMGPGEFSEASGVTKWSDLARQGSDNEIVDLCESMAQYLPREWINAMVDSAFGRGAVKFKKVGRGNFRQNGGVTNVQVSAYGSAEGLPAGASTALHEMTHWAESAIKSIREMEWAYYRRRTVTDGVQEKTISMKALRPSRGYSQEEIAREDLWADPYSGKDYGNWINSFYEVMTMGIEGAFRTSSRGGIDADHKRFVLGMLALLRRAV